MEGHISLVLKMLDVGDFCAGLGARGDVYRGISPERGCTTGALVGAETGSEASVMGEGADVLNEQTHVMSEAPTSVRHTSIRWIFEAGKTWLG